MVVFSLNLSKSALVAAGLCSLILVFLFIHTEVLLGIDQPVFIALNGVAFVLCWLFLSFLMDRFSIPNILYILSLFAMANLADYHLPVSKNPITIPLILIFWFGVGNLMLPQFFKKYLVAILAGLGLLMSYYFLHFYTTIDYSLNDRRSFANFALIPIPIFIALWGYEQWKWLETLKSEKANAELALLKSQINPHFFFNTLNNLYGLVMENSKRAPEVVLKLSGIMRYTIYEGQKERVRLGHEVSYLEDYIELHKIRYQKEVDIQFTHTIDESLEVSPLLFIILLENAFKHGVEKIREQAYVHLRMKTVGKNILFEIENNFKRTESEGNKGIGMDNLKRRLDHLYPNSHELRVEEASSIYKVTLKLGQ